MSTFPRRVWTNISRLFKIKTRKESGPQDVASSQVSSPEHNVKNLKHVKSDGGFEPNIKVENSKFSSSVSKPTPRQTEEAIFLQVEQKDIYRLKSTWKAVHRKVDEAGVELFLLYALQAFYLLNSIIKIKIKIVNPYPTRFENLYRTIIQYIVIKGVRV